MKYIIVTVCLFFLGLSRLFSQQDMADSLFLALQKAEGEKKADIYCHLADIYGYINTEKALEYAKEGMKLSGKLGYEKGLANSYGCMGYSYITLDNQQAVKYTKKALEIRRKINDRPGVGNSLNVLGIIYYTMGNYPASLDYHLKAITLREEIGDDSRTCGSYNNIALVHMAIKNFNEALIYLEKSLRICIRANDKQGIGIIYDNIGEIYSRKGEYGKALEYFSMALEINREIGNTKSEGNSCFNSAKLYKKMNDTAKALHYLQESLRLYSKAREKEGISNAENGMASIFFSQGRIDDAIRHAQTALNNALPASSLDNISIASGILHQAYQKAGNYPLAYKYLSIHKNATDSLNNVEKIKRVTKIEYDHKLEKIKREQEAALSRQDLFIKWLIVTLFLSLIIVILIIRSYSQNRKSNIRLHELNSRLKELNAAKDRFFSIIAHDLRGPFQALLGISDMLIAEADTLSKEEIRSSSEVLRMSLQNQYELLNDLLDWSRLQHGGFTLRCERLSLKDMLGDIIKSLELIASQKEIRLVNSVRPGLEVSADRNMLQLVLRNLISNGIKFTRKGGEVKVCAENMNGSVRLIVEDNGIGIAPGDVQKLFKVDANHSTIGTANEMGTGLGLVLCREIVEKHSGQIEVESIINVGSRFIITLPAEIKNS